MTTSRPTDGADVWPPARVRMALPFAALAVLVATLHLCAHVRAARHGGDPWGGELPVIPSLGRDMPEHAWFAAGFTVLAAVLSIVFRARARMIALEPRATRSRAIRAAVHACSAFAVLSMGSMLVMAWIPDGASPLHFLAALATFGALALYEVVHACLCVALARREPLENAATAPPRHPGPLVRAWLFVCPFAAMTFVYLWISDGNVPAQYAAVAMQFAYFLPLSRAFGEPAAPLRSASPSGTTGQPA